MTPACRFTLQLTGRNNAFGIAGVSRFYGTSNECVGVPITGDKDKSLERNRATSLLLKFFSPKEGLDSVQKEIVNALRLGKRDQASSLLSEYVSGRTDLKSEDFVHIMKYCAAKKDPLFVMEALNLMVEKEIPVSGKSYLLLFRVLCKGGYLKEAFDILNYLEQNSDVTPALPVYSSLLRASIRFKNLNYANDCLNLMEHHALGQNEITYRLLLKLAVLNQNLPAVHVIWKELIKLYPMSIITLRKLIWAFTTLNDLESACVVLQQMVTVTSQCDFRFVQTAKGNLHLARLDIHIPYQLTCDSHEENNITTNSLPEDYFIEGTNKSGLSLSEKPLSQPVRTYLRWSFNDLIHACAKTQNAELSEKLMFQMQNLKLEPSAVTYDCYVRALLSGRNYRVGMKVLKVMQQKNLKPHESTLAAISVSCSKASKLNLAENLLDQIPNSYAYPYNAFFEACGNLDQPERALRVLAKMKKLNVTPDIKTYELLFKVFGNVNASYEDGNMSSQVDVAKRIECIEMDMVKHGFQHSLVSLQNLMYAVGMEGMIDEMIRYLNVAEKLFFHSDSSVETRIYDIVLHSLVKAKETDMAIKIFKSMVSHGLPQNSATHSIMIDCCSVLRCYRSACSLVSMMIRGGFPLHRVTYTTLLKVFLGLDDFDEAVKLLELARSEGFQPDVVLYNTILQRASETGRIDVIELFVEQMHQEEIQPDTSTCVHVFLAYVENGLVSTAMEALHVLSMRMISLQDDILEEARLKYESLILSEDSEAESLIIDVFRERPTLAVALLQLRGCVIFETTLNWSPSQSPWSKRLSSDYSSRRGNSRVYQFYQFR